MRQQLLFNRSVQVVDTKVHGTQVREFTLSDPSLMALGFAWKAFGAHFHLYRRELDGNWNHLFQGASLQDGIHKAQVI